MATTHGFPDDKVYDRRAARSHSVPVCRSRRPTRTKLLTEELTRLTRVGLAVRSCPLSEVGRDLVVATHHLLELTRCSS